MEWVDEMGYQKALIKAKNKQAEFINGLLSRAQEEFDRGETYNALFHFGMAMHPIMDAYSPAHRWQVYGLSGQIGYDIAMAYVHYEIENRAPTSSETAGMRGEIRDRLRCVVSQKFYDVATSKSAFFSAS